MLTPLELLIDRACQVSDPEDHRCKRYILMRCRECLKEKSVLFDPSVDPKGALTLEFTCPDCGGSNEPISYFDYKNQLMK